MPLNNQVVFLAKHSALSAIGCVSRFKSHLPVNQDINKKKQNTKNNKRKECPQIWNAKSRCCGCNCFRTQPAFSGEQQRTVECGYIGALSFKWLQFQLQRANNAIQCSHCVHSFQSIMYEYIYIYKNLFFFLNLTTALGCVICPIHFKSDVCLVFLPSAVRVLPLICSHGSASFLSHE